MPARERLLLSSIVAAALGVGGAAGAAPASSALLVLNKTDNTYVRVDLGTWQVGAPVPVGVGPHELAVSDDGRLAFAANYGDGQTIGSSISVIDVATNKELRRFDTAPLLRPHGFAVSGGKLYFTSETSRVVARYDPAKNAIDWIVGTGQTQTHMVAASRDGRTLYTANIAGNSVSIIEIGTTPAATTVTSIPVGKGPEGIHLTPDGTQLWAAHSQDGGISIIDTATKKVIATMDAKTGRSNRLVFTLDGTRALVSDINNGDVAVIDVKTRAVTTRVKVGASPEGILMDPDGTRAFVAVTGDNEIAVLDLKTLAVTRRIRPGGGPDGMAFVK